MTEPANPLKTSIWNVYSSHFQQPIEEWEKNVKKTLSNWVLAPSQRVHSFNSRPHLMMLLLTYEIYLQVKDILYYLREHVDNPFHDWIIYTYASFGVFLPILFIGIPMEIAHGTLQTTVLCCIFHLYPKAVELLIMNSTWRFLMTNISPCLIGFHLANMVRNWTSTSFKPARIIFMLMFTLPVNIYSFWILYKDIWRVALIGYTCEISAILIGFVLGYYWVYSPPQEQEKSRLQNWKNYAAIITILTAYLLIAEFSELHMSFDEFMFKHGSHLFD